MIKKKVKHVDGITDVIATGFINEQNEFVGEYKHNKMTYGVLMPMPLYDVARSLANYQHVLEQMNGDKEATIVCLKMMTWLIKDIEINIDKHLREYKEIWENAYNISLESRIAH